MSNNDTSNVSQVLKAILHFVNLFENPLWAKDASAEDVMSTFKLGQFIEYSITIFSKKEFLSQFLILLEIWGKQNDLKSYSESFYTCANDHLLCKLFKTPNIKDSILDVGVRVYTSLYPKQRFEKCLNELILISSSVRTIVDVVNDCVTSKTQVENELILEKWSEYCKTDLVKQNLISEVNSYLTLYKVEESLPRLISIMALDNVSERHTSAVTVIVSCLENKMLDRSLLSKTFWTTLFTKINLGDIQQACKHHPQFLKSLLDFIKYVASMMRRDETQSVSDELSEWTLDQSVCFSCKSPYFCIVIILKSLCNDNSLKKCVFECIEEASKYSNATLWQQIMLDITD